MRNAKEKLFKEEHMFKYLETRERKVSVTLVRSFVEMEACPGDRAINEGRLSFLTKEFRDGRIIPFDWVIAVCKGVEYRVNGKHSSNVLLANPDILDKFDCVALIKKFDCPTMNDVVELYNTLDARESSRTPRELVQTVAASSAKMRDKSKKFLTAISTGMAYAQFEEQYNMKVNAHARAKSLKNNLPFVDFVSDIDSQVQAGKKRTFLQRTPVVAAMYLTWNRDKGAAAKFWALVATGSGATPSTPDRHLERLLRDSSISRGSNRSGVPNVSAREFFCSSIMAWNHWRNGDTEIKKIKYNKVNPTPDVL